MYLNNWLLNINYTLIVYWDGRPKCNTDDSLLNPDLNNWLLNINYTLIVYWDGRPKCNTDDSLLNPDLNNWLLNINYTLIVYWDGRPKCNTDDSLLNPYPLCPGQYNPNNFSSRWTSCLAPSPKCDMLPSENWFIKLLPVNTFCTLIQCKHELEAAEISSVWVIHTSSNVNHLRLIRRYILAG